MLRKSRREQTETHIREYYISTKKIYGRCSTSIETNLMI